MNGRKHKIAKLVTFWEDKSSAKNLISESNFYSLDIFDHLMLKIEIKNFNIKFNKPIHFGCPILEFPK